MHATLARRWMKVRSKYHPHSLIGSRSDTLRANHAAAASPRAPVTVLCAENLAWMSLMSVERRDDDDEVEEGEEKDAKELSPPSPLPPVAPAQ
jgi:hypothetical protein